MRAAGQREAGGIDLVDQFNQRLALEAHDMQHRSKHFARQIARRVQFDQGRGEEMPISAIRAERLGVDLEAPGAHRLDMAPDAGERLLRDDRADVARQPVGRADLQLAHR